MKNSIITNSLLINIISFLITLLLYVVFSLDIIFFLVICFLINLLFTIILGMHIIIVKKLIDFFFVIFNIVLLKLVLAYSLNLWATFCILILFGLISLWTNITMYSLLHRIGISIYNKALSFYERKKFKSALKYLYISRLFLDGNYLNENIGRVYLNIEEYRKAICEFLKCLKYNDQPYLHEYIAAAYIYLNNEEKALEHRLEAYNFKQNKDNNIEFLDYQANLWELWRLYFKKGECKKSLKYIQEYIELYPDDCNAYNVAGYSASEIDKKLEYQYYNQAYKCCKKNDIDKETIVTTLWNLAITSSDINKKKESIYYFKELVTIEPDNIRAIYDLGKVYFSMQNYIESEKIFSSIIASDNAYSNRARLYLILIHIENNNEDKVEKLVQADLSIENLEKYELEQLSYSQIHRLKKIVSA